MEVTAFEQWVGAIEGLTVSQRRQVWQALALSEASDGSDHEADAPVVAVSGNAGPAVSGERPGAMALPLPRPPERSETEIVAALGQRPVAPTATAATSCIGARPAPCRATAAKPVGAPSTH
jgi:hypothetical protein